MRGNQFPPHESHAARRIKNTAAALTQQPSHNSPHTPALTQQQQPSSIT